MRKFIFTLYLIIGITTFCFSNNISVTNVTLTGQNTSSDYTLVQFDISWSNSWRTSTYESNWDAAWIFVKWRLKTSTAWNHATLNTSGHTTPTGSTITTPSDGKGVFMYRNADGIGNISWTAAQLQWNYGVDGLLDADLVEISVSAIEMVYIPQGSFYVGFGGFYGECWTYPSIQGYFITSEGVINVGNTNGYLTYENTYPSSGDMGGPIPAEFPKGYNAFYMMKYEITQEQYVECLNKLTYTQQATRTVVAPSSAAGTSALYNTYRNGISVLTPGVDNNQPAVYACELNVDAIYNNVDDGQNIACNWLKWADLAAYLDWSGLRPFTEFEFEKACRGSNLSAVYNEYAWGNTTVTGATGVSNSGYNNEYATNAGANCICNNLGVQGPMRVGNFAQGATNRQNSGGSYYGVMELTGNVYERPITFGNATGRSFIGNNGDGILNSSGDANVSSWPTTDAIGAGFRGGSWSGIYSAIHHRLYGASVSTSRSNDFGGRGCRIAP
ncbi:MAG: hypothetical protein A2046_05230 [Bacteroidetes bacterium GWA2_30_7]|nr:MAG: hypothetical protein A2046_05230 [Bacteroidetes bacterium GWA2_30_7]